MSSRGVGTLSKKKTQYSVQPAAKEKPKKNYRKAWEGGGDLYSSGKGGKKRKEGPGNVAEKKNWFPYV